MAHATARLLALHVHVHKSVVSVPRLSVRLLEQMLTHSPRTILRVRSGGIDGVVHKGDGWWVAILTNEVRWYDGARGRLLRASQFRNARRGGTAAQTKTERRRVGAVVKHESARLALGRPLGECLAGGHVRERSCRGHQRGRNRAPVGLVGDLEIAQHHVGFGQAGALERRRELVLILPQNTVDSPRRIAVDVEVDLGAIGLPCGRRLPLP
mmetsp:Transcript_71136/g.199968  ORF Transcript_71136/g.199968 Transcript_71136/m.199968 type:complete len:211 (-) Transcript_71136:201-833(-)